jgi:hypothetical protein
VRIPMIESSRLVTLGVVEDTCRASGLLEQSVAADTPAAGP